MLWSLAVLKACNPDVWCAGMPRRCNRPGATTGFVFGGRGQGMDALPGTGACRASGLCASQSSGRGALAFGTLARGYRLTEAMTGKQ